MRLEPMVVSWLPMDMYRTNDTRYGRTRNKKQQKELLYVRNWIYHLLFYSSTPLEQSSNHPEDITVDRYGIFTANFRLPHQLTTGELFTYLTGAISAAVGIIGASLVIPGWWRGRKQRRFEEVSLTHLKECIKMIDEDVGKSHRNAIKEKIMGHRVDGKLSEIIVNC